MSDLVEPGTEILNWLKLEEEAELTREVSTELTLDSYGVPRLYFCWEQPP